MAQVQPGNQLQKFKLPKAKLLVAVVDDPEIGGAARPPDEPMNPDVRNCRGPEFPNRIATPDSNVVLAAPIVPIGS